MTISFANNRWWRLRNSSNQFLTLETVSERNFINQRGRMNEWIVLFMVQYLITIPGKSSIIADSPVPRPVDIEDRHPRRRRQTLNIALHYVYKMATLSVWEYELIFIRLKNLTLKLINYKIHGISLTINYWNYLWFCKCYWSEKHFLHVLRA